MKVFLKQSFALLSKIRGIIFSFCSSSPTSGKTQQFSYFTTESKISFFIISMIGFFTYALLHLLTQSTTSTSRMKTSRRFYIYLFSYAFCGASDTVMMSKLEDWI